MPFLIVVSMALAVALISWLSPRPVAQLPSPRRLANGAIISGQTLGGHGVLEIDNGTSTDAIVKVVDQRAHHAVETCYVSGGGKVSIQHIPDGTFSVIFASGSDFDPILGGFTREKRFSKFVDALAYRTLVLPTESGVDTQYTVFTLTLHPVVNGNAKTDSIGEDEFLKL